MVDARAKILAKGMQQVALFLTGIKVGRHCGAKIIKVNVPDILKCLTPIERKYSMTLRQMVYDALTHGRTDTYTGYPETIEDCNFHVREVFNFDKLHVREIDLICSATIDWFNEYQKGE